MDAKHVLERVASLKQEMQDLRVENARLDEPRHDRGNYEARLSRLEQIKTELAEIIGQFKPYVENKHRCIADMLPSDRIGAGSKTTRTTDGEYQGRRHCS